MDGAGIKQEPPAVAVGDDIKEFAETAMNELLGWYGYDGRCSREEMNRLHSGGDSSEPESPRYLDGTCGWCNRRLDGMSPSLTSTSGAFCSELCFSQSRRASFKRNKTCDWCRHVRHTVSYVDFQDGARQLQFCSDKCLNQYKMQIFCRETRAHLELHPHLHNASSSGDDSALITPDLWMRDCKDSGASSPSVNVSEPPGNRRRSVARKNVSKRSVRTPRTSTITSENSESPQDLRVRPRSPDPDKTPVAPAKDEKAPMPTQDEGKRTWPPPVTVLVPYPILIPIPLPIPIPIPVDKFKQAYQTADDKTNEKCETRRSRTLRRRKKMTDEEVKNRPSVFA